MESLIKINLYLELERIKTIIIPSSFDAFVFEAVNCNELLHNYYNPKQKTLTYVRFCDIIGEIENHIKGV